MLLSTSVAVSVPPVLCATLLSVRLAVAVPVIMAASLVPAMAAALYIILTTIFLDWDFFSYLTTTVYNYDLVRPIDPSCSYNIIILVN